MRTHFSIEWLSQSSQSFRNSPPVGEHRPGEPEVSQRSSSLRHNAGEFSSAEEEETSGYESEGAQNERGPFHLYSHYRKPIKQGPLVSYEDIRFFPAGAHFPYTRVPYDGSQLNRADEWSRSHSPGAIRESGPSVSFNTHSQSTGTSSLLPGALKEGALFALQGDVGSQYILPRLNSFSSEAQTLTHKVHSLSSKPQSCSPGVQFLSPKPQPCSTRVHSGPQSLSPVTQNELVISHSPLEPTLPPGTQSLSPSDNTLNNRTGSISPGTPDEDMASALSAEAQSEGCSASPKAQSDPSCPGRRPRTAFTAPQIRSLEQMFQRSPYLGAQDKAELCRSLQLSDKQIRNWFQNRRMKLKRSLQDGLTQACQFKAASVSHTMHFPELQAFRSSLCPAGIYPSLPENPNGLSSGMHFNQFSSASYHPYQSQFYSLH